MRKTLEKTKLNERGITLIALVITIIILLILSGISIDMLTGNNNILNRATEAKEKTSYEAAREKLEVTLSDALILKNTDITYNEDDYLTRYINNEINLNKNAWIEENILVVDGWVFEIDRSVPKIGSELGKKEELGGVPEITHKEVSEYNAETKKVTVTITAEEEKNGIKSIIVVGGGQTQVFDAESNIEEFLNPKRVTIVCELPYNGTYEIEAIAKLTTRDSFICESYPAILAFSVNGSSTWAKTASTIPTLTGKGKTITNCKYAWAKSGEEPESKDYISFENGSEISNTTATGKYKLWIRADVDGIETTIGSSEEFYLDNMAPTFSVELERYEYCRTRTKVIGTDSESGMKSVTASVPSSISNSIKYSTTSESNYYQFQGLIYKGIYNINITAVDNSGNSITKTLTITIPTMFFWSEMGPATDSSKYFVEMVREFNRPT